MLSSICQWKYVWVTVYWINSIQIDEVGRCFQLLEWVYRNVSWNQRKDMDCTWNRLRSIFAGKKSLTKIQLRWSLSSARFSLFEILWRVSVEYVHVKYHKRLFTNLLLSIPLSQCFEFFNLWTYVYSGRTS